MNDGKELNDKDLELKIREPDKKQPRDKVALATLVISILSFGSSGWFGHLQADAARKSADEAQKTRVGAEQSAKEQADDVKQSRDAAERSADAAQSFADGMQRNADAAVSAASTAHKAFVDTQEARRISDAEHGKELAVAEEHLELSERPWLSVKVEPSTGLSYEPDWGNLTLRFRVINTGHTTATEIRIDPKLTAGLIGASLGAQKKICEDARQNSTAGDAVLVGEELVVDHDFHLPKKEILKGTFGIPERQYPIELQGCVTYALSTQRIYPPNRFLV